MPPRYQPLSVDQSGASYRSTAASGLASGASSVRSSSRSAFYCSCVPLYFGEIWDRVAHRLPDRTQVVGYIAGALFALGWWAFIDGVAYSSSRDPPLPNTIRFEDWIPGILSSVSLIIVNLINKDTLTADDFSYSGSNVACKARAAAFIGVTMALGAIGGSLDSSESTGQSRKMTASKLSKRTSSQSIINGMVILFTCILILVVALVMGTTQHHPHADTENDANQHPIKRQQQQPAQQKDPAQVIPRWISEDELDDEDMYGPASGLSQRQKLERRIIDANGNGITFPTTNTPLTIGTTYTARFVTAQAWNWTSIRLDLYTIASEERFITNLNTVDASRIVNPMSLQGEIPFTLASSVGTGAVYVLRISGTDRRTGLPLILPRSEVFSIVDPNAGQWVYPNSDTVLYTGRTITLNFTLGRPFMSATRVRIEISSAVMPNSMVIVNSIPLDFTNKYTTVSWNIPPYFKKGQFYFLRVLPNDGPYSTISDATTGVGLSLPSAGFTLFENSVFNQKELTITALPSVVQTGSQTNIRYSYSGTSRVSRWNIDLFSAGPYTRFPLGLT
ncbi:Transmembrane protein 50A, partial [Dinochytrium kinnereticum]